MSDGAYRFGDLVVYDPGHKRDIGRVTECRKESAFVCYGLGCTLMDLLSNQE